MKVTVIVPTGEVRPPKLGECFKDDKGTWGVASGNWITISFPIGKVHEIELPDNTTELKWYGVEVNECLRGTTTGIGFIPLLPLPKKKIKKWQWLVGCMNANKGGEVYVPHGYWDRANATEFWGNRWICQPILETEVEVDND